MAKSVGNFWRLHLPILLLRLPMLFELYKFAEVGESEFLDFFFSPCCYFIEISYKLVKSGELLIKYIDL